MSGSDAAPSEAADSRRGPGRPRDARHDEAILTAARELLQEQGYSPLTIEAVASRAGVGRPTIYRRWPSKPALVVTALIQSARLAVPEPDTGSLRGDLVEVQRHQVELMSSADNRRVTAGLVADLAADSELAEIYVSEYLSPRRETVWQVLQRGIDRGELAPDADLAFAYDLLVGPLFMRAVVWGQPLPPDAAEQTTDAVIAAFPGARVGRDSSSPSTRKRRSPTATHRARKR